MMGRAEDEAREELLERLDDLSGAAGLGILKAPKAEPAAQPEQSEPEAEAHHHMLRFPMFVADEKGLVVEVDPNDVAPYECSEDGCEDPTHDHTHRDQEGGHTHGEPVAKPRVKPSTERRARKT